MSFQLSLITPEGRIFEDTVESLAAPGLLGGFEVYSGHACFLAALKEGKLRVRKGGREQVFTTGSGVLEVSSDHNVLALVDSASSQSTG